MNISYVKHINAQKNNRIEYLFVNFDYFDGNDLISKILFEKYNVTIGKKIDGMFYTIIPLSFKGYEYNLLWHEDVGNSIYSKVQDNKSLDQIEKLVNIIVDEINSRIRK